MAKHGKRYIELRKKIEAEKLYPVEEAMSLVLVLAFFFQAEDGIRA